LATKRYWQEFRRFSVGFLPAAVTMPLFPHGTDRNNAGLEPYIMSHEVTHRVDGTAEMAYVGDTPWWEGGNRLEPGQSIEAWKAAAGMDWGIASAPVQYTVNGSILTAASRVVLYRDDNHLPLGVVSPSFLPVHPGETLEFFRDLTEGAGFHMETAGTLPPGRSC
jgi:hypothetical protein